MPRFPRLRRVADRLLHIHDTPRRTAAAFALGVFVGFSPFLGLQTLLGLLLAFAFGLNRLAVLIGLYVNLPWLMPAYYVMATAVGAALLGARVPPEFAHQLRQLLTWPGGAELRMIAMAFTPLIWPFVAGSMLGAAVLSFLAYHLAVAMIAARRGRRDTLENIRM